MRGWTRRRWIRALGATAVVVVLLLAIGPFLVPVRPLEGLAPARQSATDESQFVTIPFEGTDGIEIHYVADGLPPGRDAPTFVLLHGSMFNANTWRDVMGFFAERGRVVFLIPWYGRTLLGTTDDAFTGDPGKVHLPF